MNKCINQSHPNFLNLLASSNMNPHILAAKIAIWQTQNKTENFPKLQDILKPQEVNATLKVINALVDFPRKFYPSNSIQGFYNDLTKRGVPKDQIELLKDYIAQNNIKEINVNDLMVGLLSEMSYTIEIYTAKHRYSVRAEEPEYREDGSQVNNGDPSQYYSNMTVPGGTNYTENNINTPEITPSIQGHAQFQEMSSIGWFRSDEQQHIVKDDRTDDEFFKDLESVNKPTEFTQTKTRRILEVQSDLFQKGRGKEDLSEGRNSEWSFSPVSEAEYQEAFIKGEYLQLPKSNLTWHDETSGETKNSKAFAYEYNGKYYTNKNGSPVVATKITNTKNQFLQLLNKDNNWVTFFVKSIIQDSAKKGYEKVLFPLGDTAAKVEGHQTLEDYMSMTQKNIDKLSEKLTIEGLEKEFKSEYQARKELIEHIKNRNVEPIYENLDKIKDDYINGELIDSEFNYTRVRQNFFNKNYKNLDQDATLSGDNYDGWVIQEYTVGKGQKITKISKERAFELYKENYNNKKLNNEIDLKEAQHKIEELLLGKDAYIKYTKDTLEGQLKTYEQQLEDVLAGDNKFSSIANFYETIITNILKKQGYSPNKVIDEYGNSWNEVRLSPAFLDTISFNKPEKDNTFFKKQILKYLKDKGIIGIREFPAGSGNFYVKKTYVGQDTKYYAPEEVERLNLQKIDDINQKLGFNAIETVQVGNGLVVKINSQLSLFDEFNEEDLVEQEVTPAEVTYKDNNLLTEDVQGLIDNAYRISMSLNKQDMINVGTIIKKNQGLLSNVTVKIGDYSIVPEHLRDYYEKERPAASYDAGDDAIYIFKNVLDNYSIEQSTRIVMEELIHALTVQPFYLKEMGVELDKNEATFVNSINKLYDYYKSNANEYLKTRYRFSNQREFIIGMILDKNFKDHLEEIDRKKAGFLKTMINDFINAILKFFGIKTNKEIKPFEKLTISYINQYIDQIPGISPLLADSRHDLSSFARDIRQEKESLITSLNDAQKAQVKAKILTFIQQIKSISGTSRMRKGEVRDSVMHMQKEYKKFTNDDIDQIDFFFDFVNEMNRIFDTLIQKGKDIQNDKVVAREELQVANGIRLGRWATVMNTVQDFDSNIRELSLIRSELLEDNPIAQEIGKIISKRDQIERNYSVAIFPMVTDILAKTVEPSQKPRLDYLNDELRHLNESLARATKYKSTKRISDLEKEIEIRTKERDTIYNVDSNAIQTWLRGEMGDANTLSSYLEAAIVSGNPIVASQPKLIKDKLHEIDSEILDIANKIQTEIDAYAKDSGLNKNNIEKFNEPLLETYKVIEKMDDNGNITWKDKLSLLGPWNLQYIADLQTFSFKRYKLIDKLDKATDETRESIEKQLEENTQSRRQFIKDYMERRYLDEVHEAQDLIYEVLHGKDSEGNDITFTAYDILGEKYDDIDDIQKLIEETKDDFEKDRLYNLLDEKNLEIKLLRSTYEKDPDSNEWKVANQLRKRDEALKKYRKFVLTQNGEIKFKREKARMDQLFEDGERTEKERNFWYQQNTRTELSDQYWKDKLDILEKMNDILAQLNTKRGDGEEVGKLYKEIENIVKPYRDLEGVIDGDKFNQKQALDIKSLEEKIEKLKEEIPNIFGLTKSERIELANLYSKLEEIDYKNQSERDPNIRQSIHEEQINIESRIKDITEKKKILNKALVAKYFDLVKKLSDIDETTTTHYYEQRYEKELENHSLNQSLIGLTDKFSYGNFIYERIGNEWFARDAKESKKIEQSEAERNFRMKKGENSFMETPWYQNNHILRTKWVKSDISYDPSDPYQRSGEWEEVQEPIYIWRFSSPVNNKYVLEGQPALKYKRQVILDDFKNPHYRESLNGYNIPRLIGAKDSRYVNSRYTQLGSSENPKDKATFRYLNQMTKLYEEAQIAGYLPKNARPGLDMPSIREGFTERLEGVTAKGLIEGVGQWYRGLKDTVVKNEQDKDILYGYTDNKGSVPIKFTGAIDIKDISHDVARSIGMFYVGALQRQKLMEAFPIMKATLDIVEDNTPVVMKNGKVATMAKKFLGSNAVVAKHISGRGNTVNQINELIKTFIFGEKIKDEKFSKQINSTLGIGASLMLGLNFGSMIQNWTNAKIQSILEGESKLTKNFTIKDWTKAEAIYWANINKIVADSNKYGNKSYIGQFMDFFGGINFKIESTFNRSSAYKGLMQGVSKFLMPTELAEHQLSTVLFLSVGLNTKVDMKIGDQVEKISLYDAFHIENGQFKLKNGVELSKDQKEDFINRLNSSARRINGEYGNMDSPLMHKYQLGRLFEFMNKYFIPFFMRRFGKRRFSIQDGIRDDGFWRVFGRTLFNDIKRFQLNVFKNWKYYTPSQRAAIKQTTTEMSVSFTLMMMMSMLGGDGDKEVKDNGILANNIIYVLKGIRRQNEQFMLVPGLGLDDVYNRLKNPFPIMTKVGNAFSVLNDLMYLAGYTTGIGGIEEKDIYYTKKSGWHNKGDLKIWADVGKLLSGPNKYQQILHPDVALKNLNAYRIK